MRQTSDWVAIRFAGAVLLSVASAGAAKPSAGVEARWRVDRIELTVDASFEQLAPGALESVEASASTWQSAEAETPTVSIRRGQADAIGYAPGRANQSSLRAVPENNPLVKSALAATVVTLEAKSGTILDADVLFNQAYRFERIGSQGSTAEDAYDLQAVLTHELGHLHGLDDDFVDRSAAMYSKTAAGDTRQRFLNASDEGALIALYPADSRAEREPSASCANGPGLPSLAGAAIASCAVALAALGLRRRPVAWRAGAIGLGFAALSGTVSAGEPVAGMHAGPSAVVTATVAATSARWQAGLIVTELALSDVACQGECRVAGDRALVFGGRVGDIVQVVSHAPVPEQGARVRIELSNHAQALGRYRVISH